MEVRNLFKEKNVAKLLGWGIIPLVYLAMCFSTISYHNEIYKVFAWGILVIAVLCYHFVLRLVDRGDDKLSREIELINVVVTILGCLLIIVIIKQCRGVELAGWMASVGMWIVAAIWNLIKHRPHFQKLVVDNKGAWLLAIVAVLLGYDSYNTVIKWDGLQYYIVVGEARLDSLSSLGLYGHISQSSGGLYRLFSIIAGNIKIGMTIANIAAMVVGIIGFYGCIKIVVRGRKWYEYMVATSIYAFSPFILGMVGYFSTDWFTVNFITMLCYCLLSKQYYIGTVMGVLFCMTKEPAIIAYGGLCLGIVVADLITQSGKFIGRIKLILSRVHYYYLLIPIIIWLGTYKIVGPWNGGTGGFKIDSQYVVNKILLFMVFNYNWIFTVIILIGGIVITVRKRFYQNLKWILPLAFSNIFLLIFNIVFFTANHPRYIDSFVSIQILLAVLLLMNLFDAGIEKAEVKRKLINNVTMTIIAVIMLTSCWISSDPVSKELFSIKNINGARIYSTAYQFIGDSSIYNKQMIWMEKPIDDAIADAIEDGSVIVIPTLNGSAYATDGLSLTVHMNDVLEHEKQYWNSDKKCRVEHCNPRISDGDINIIDVYHIKNDSVLADLPISGKNVSIIYVKGLNDYMMSDIYEVQTSEDYRYRGWIVTRDVLSLKEND